MHYLIDADMLIAVFYYTALCAGLVKMSSTIQTYFVLFVLSIITLNVFTDTTHCLYFYPFPKLTCI